MEATQQTVSSSIIPKKELWERMTAEISTEGAKNTSSLPVEISVTSNIQDIEIPIFQEDVSACPPMLEVVPAAQNEIQVAIINDRFPNNLSSNLGIILDQHGKAYATIKGAGNAYALAVGSKALNNRIRQLGMEEGIRLRKNDLTDLNHTLQAEAEMAAIRRDVWHRVAQIQDGIEIDLGNERHTHVRITPGRVEIISEGSDTLFCRSQVSRAMALPAKVGNLDLLKKYLNLDPVQVMLFKAWITYTLAHPKIPASKFVILVLQGNQGSGKSLLCRVVQQLIDPSVVGVQVMPSNPKDLSIAAQNAHVLCYDNLRTITQSMSDILCTAATGGTISSRQLYSDADMNVIQLHVALVLNGIHSFIDQPDLAQRCLPLELLPISEGSRKSEGEFERDFQRDLPEILRGLFDLIANVFTHLPTATITNPERMIDFVQWLSGMEMAQGIPAGIYQAAYSQVLNQGQLDSLLDNLLASEILIFARSKQVDGEWSGTPADLLNQLSLQASVQTMKSREWPQNAIALSKRLKPLQASLMTQGVYLEFTRGKERLITVKMSAQFNTGSDEY